MGALTHNHTHTVYTHTHTQSHTDARTLHSHKHTNEHVHANTCIHIQKHEYTHTHTHVHTHTHTHIMHMHAKTYASTHMHAWTRTHMHAHVHACAPTHAQVYTDVHWTQQISFHYFPPPHPFPLLYLLSHLEMLTPPLLLVLFLLVLHLNVCTDHLWRFCWYSPGREFHLGRPCERPPSVWKTCHSCNTFTHINFNITLHSSPALWKVWCSDCY